MIDKTLKEQIEQFANDNTLGVTFSDNIAEFEFVNVDKPQYFQVEVGENFGEFANNLRQRAENAEFHIDYELKAALGIEYNEDDYTIEDLFEEAKYIDNVLEDLKIAIAHLNTVDLTIEELAEAINDVKNAELVEYGNETYGLEIDLYAHNGQVDRWELGTEWDLEYNDADNIASEIESLYDEFSLDKHILEKFGLEELADEDLPANQRANVVKMVQMERDLAEAIKGFSKSADAQLRNQLDKKLETTTSMSERIAITKEIKKLDDIHKNDDNKSRSQRADRDEI